MATPRLGEPFDEEGGLPLRGWHGSALSWAVRALLLLTLAVLTYWILYH